MEKNQDLRRATDELIAIFVSSAKTAKEGQQSA